MPRPTRRLFAVALCLACVLPCVAARRATASRRPTAGIDQAAFDRTFAHRLAFVGDLRLHYITGGTGPPVVLLHGWPQTWYEWRPIMLGLAQAHTVIAVDLPGAGASDKPPTGYDKRTMAEVIYQLALQLGHSRVNLVGHDIGGMVAYAFAAQHPEAVLRLAILDVPLPGIEPEWSQIRSIAWHFAFHGKRDVPELLVAGREYAYLSAFIDEQAYNPDAIPAEDVAEYARAYAEPGALRGGFEWYRAFPQDERDNRGFANTRLRMPVLALGGEISSGPFLVEHLRRVADNVTGGPVPLAGHWLAEEQPQLLLERLLAFLAAPVQ